MSTTVSDTQRAQRVVSDLQELAQLTSDEHGAQRVAFGPIGLWPLDWQ